MEINFVFQMNSFFRCKREKKLSANAQALWVELFGLFNAAYFPMELEVSTTQLSATLGISKDSALRARKELNACGLIEVERRSGRSASVIRMRYFQRAGGSMPEAPVENYVEKPENSVENPVENDVEKSALYPEEEERAFSCAEFCDAKEGSEDEAEEFAPQIASKYATQEPDCVDICDTKDDLRRHLRRKTPPYIKLNDRLNDKPTLYPSIHLLQGGKDGEKEEVSYTAWKKARSEVRRQLGGAMATAGLDPDEGSDPIFEVAELMTEVYSRETGGYTIGGVRYAADVVRERLRGLSAGQIYDAVEGMRNAPEPIRNIRGYLLSCLFNAASGQNLRAEINNARYAAR